MFCFEKELGPGLLELLLGRERGCVVGCACVCACMCVCVYVCVRACEKKNIKEQRNTYDVVWGGP